MTAYTCTLSPRRMPSACSSPTHMPIATGNTPVRPITVLKGDDALSYCPGASQYQCKPNHLCRFSAESVVNVWDCEGTNGLHHHSDTIVSSSHDHHLRTITAYASPVSHASHPLPRSIRHYFVMPSLCPRPHWDCTKSLICRRTSVCEQVFVCRVD